MKQIFKGKIQVNIIERTFQKMCYEKNQEVEGETVGVTDKPLLKIQNVKGEAVGETDRPFLNYIQRTLRMKI